MGLRRCPHFLIVLGASLAYIRFGVYWVLMGFDMLQETLNFLYK